METSTALIYQTTTVAMIREKTTEKTTDVDSMFDFNIIWPPVTIIFIIGYNFFFVKVKLNEKNTTVQKCNMKSNTFIPLSY